MGTVAIRSLAALGSGEARELSDLLIDCVEGGASVSFMWPMTRLKADAFWTTVSEGLERRERMVLVAEDGHGRIVGTVQILFNVPENQPHRADVAKMLVLRSMRRRGVGAALLASAETHAAAAGKTLLVLDTVSDSDADRMYSRHGWQTCGRIPNYALWPDGSFCDATIFFKFLGDLR